MDSILNAAISISTGSFAFLLIYIHYRNKRVRFSRIALSVLLILSTLINFTFVPQLGMFIPMVNRGFALVSLLIGLLAMYGLIVLHDIYGKTRIVSIWLIFVFIWLAGILGVGLNGDLVDVGNEGWLLDAYHSPSSAVILLSIGMLASVILLPGSAILSYYRASLPEAANRSLFWVLDSTALVVSCVLLTSGSSLLVLVGIFSLLIALTGAIYALTSYQVFDIHAGFNLALRTTIIVGITAVVIFICLFVTVNAGIGISFDGTALMSIIAVIASAIYVALRKGLELVIDPILKGTLPNSAQITRQYSQQVSQSVDLDSLRASVTQTLDKALHVWHSGILLVNDTGEGKVQLISSQKIGSKIDDNFGVLYIKSPLYQYLINAEAPISQFELEYNPKYSEMLETERDFLRSIQASVYAPILVDGRLTGILYCGSKLSDAPFYPRDLELLSTLASQTGIALRNARLVSDLRQLNQDTERLNTSLSSANLQMGKLDAVKTDFVTIASHELRTPLAQLRGYTDIMDALNEQGMLDEDKTHGMIDNMRKATERMEELIAAMLDVSQLDVNAMDLRFAPTTIEAVVRMAVEPLTDAIKQRKLTLSARGLKGLPAIEADLQRLVQAFRNVVVNAIKFTPDKGRIEVTASLKPPEESNEEPSILITIADTGVGISPENIDLIFRKFYRGYDPGLHSSGTYKFMGAGPGLGLTIARGVIEGHGGKIWAESTGNDPENFPGSTFYILLPIKSPETVRRVAMQGPSLPEHVS